MNLNFKHILWAFAVLLVVITWIFGLNIDLTGDSGLYAAISRQMVESGNWLDLKINGQAYNQKPHLLFWLAGLGIQLFGNINFAFKLFLFLVGLTGIYFTYRLGCLLFSEITGRLAALFTGTSQMFFLYFFDIHTDTVLQSTVILSLWQLAVYLEHRKTINFVFAFTAIGLAMLTKGPVGAVIPFFFVLFYLLLEKDYRQLFHPIWLAGIVLVLLIISPAVYHLWKSFGAEGVRFYFIDNNIGRVSGELTGTSTDPFYYTYNLLWAFMPWTIPVIAGLNAEIKSWFTSRNRINYNAALLGSVLVLFVVYSIARGKAPNYLMMLMPPMAVVAASRIQQLLTWPSKLQIWIIYFHYVLLTMVIVLMIASAFIVQVSYVLLLAIVAGLVLVVVLFYFKTETKKKEKLLFVSMVVVAFVNLFINTTVLPEMFKYQGARQALKIFSDNRTANGTLKCLHMEEYELFFWANVPVEDFSTWEDFYEFLDKDEPWVYTNRTGLMVVRELKSTVDSVFVIPHRGMNELSFQFLNPATREESLNNNYLIKVK